MNMNMLRPCWTLVVKLLIATARLGHPGRSKTLPPTIICCDRDQLSHTHDGPPWQRWQRPLHDQYSPFLRTA